MPRPAVVDGAVGGRRRHLLEAQRPVGAATGMLVVPRAESRNASVRGRAEDILCLPLPLREDLLLTAHGEQVLLLEAVAKDLVEERRMEHVCEEGRDAVLRLLLAVHTGANVHDVPRSAGIARHEVELCRHHAAISVLVGSGVGARRDEVPRGFHARGPLVVAIVLQGEATLARDLAVLHGEETHGLRALRRVLDDAMVQEAGVRGVERVLHGRFVAHWCHGHDPLDVVALRDHMRLGGLRLQRGLEAVVREDKQQALPDLHGIDGHRRALQLAHPRLLLRAGRHRHLDALAAAVKAPSVVPANQCAILCHRANRERRQAMRTSVRRCAPLALCIHPDDDPLPKDRQRIRLG
mmetsp:Transcript_24301/g.61611  ORF Transcript_24301/g.61611 Transcript_24301/m.61611 type:complete len:352 (+) Transcript_24301:61-1116(+)